ncbi:universal stress protein [Devosia sp. ZB163]|uniref:universal stress protein n=1 Tax=Devosia sp. ZB163 TaxID=3025938 RepID=UPI00235F3A62|nr:universal stress protein [Devosia sp. ZB163]MDC9822648.1 universal stress protein [Devosia sp. ZB163]
MIKVILVRFDGNTTPDGLRLHAARELAQLFDAQVVGLYLNVLPSPIPRVDLHTDAWSPLVAAARKSGDIAAAELKTRLAELGQRSELRRFDVFEADIGWVCAREARAADVFLTLRPSASGDSERQDVVETVLFRGGRHLLLVNDRRSYEGGFKHAVIAWNGSCEVARALSEARPYLHNTRIVTVLVVGRGGHLEIDALIGEKALGYLKAHGIEGRLRTIPTQGSVADGLIEEFRALDADLAIMGGYGHSRLAEWLLGGTTRKLLQRSPVPLLIAH